MFFHTIFTLKYFLSAVGALLICLLCAGCGATLYPPRFGTPAGLREVYQGELLLARATERAEPHEAHAAAGKDGAR